MIAIASQYMLWHEWMQAMYCTDAIKTAPEYQINHCFS